MHAVTLTLLLAMPGAKPPQAPPPPQAPAATANPANPAGPCGVPDCPCGCRDGKPCTCNGKPDCDSAPGKDGWIRRKDGTYYRWAQARPSPAPPPAAPGVRGGVSPPLPWPPPAFLRAPPPPPPLLLLPAPARAAPLPFGGSGGGGFFSRGGGGGC